MIKSMRLEIKVVDLLSNVPIIKQKLNSMKEMENIMKDLRRKYR